MNSLDELFFLPEEKSTAGDGTIVLATVYAVDEDEGLTLIFDGDSSASQKKYKMLMNGKTPEIGDRVAAVKHSGTYIVLGAIGTNGGGGGGGGGDTAEPNTVYAGPASGDEPGEATFRQLVADDIDLSGAGFVQKTGDEMTGNLDIVSSDLHQDSPPSSGTFGKMLRFLDGDGNVMAQIKPELWSDGSQTLTLQALVKVNGTVVNNWLSVTKRKDGTSEMSIGSPIPLNSGGTGTTSSEYVSSGVFTAASGFTLSGAYLRIWGRLAVLRIYIKKDSADSSTGLVKVGSIAASKYSPLPGQGVAVTDDGRVGCLKSPTATLPAEVHINGPFTTSYFWIIATYMI